MPDVPPAGELAALRARVAELEERLAARDAQLEAAQARLAELAEQIEELRRRLGRDSLLTEQGPVFPQLEGLAVALGCTVTARG